MRAVRNGISLSENVRYENRRYHVRAVTRALDVLLAFRELTPPVDLTTLARTAGLHPTTTYRYVESLISRGLVREAEGGYELGSCVVELSGAFLRGLSIWNEAPELAQRLAREADETANVGVLDDGQVLYIAIANGQRELGIQSQAGTRHPAYCTSLGKVLLAARPWPEVESLLAMRPPRPLTDHTLTDPSKIRDELHRVRELGYAVDDEERAPGVVCIGAPIRDHRGVTVAAISISGPAFRMRERGIEQLAAVVTRAADAASARLGAPVSRLPQTVVVR